MSWIVSQIGPESSAPAVEAPSDYRQCRLRLRSTNSFVRSRSKKPFKVRTCAECVWGVGQRRNFLRSLGDKVFPVPAGGVLPPPAAARRIKASVRRFHSWPIEKRLRLTQLQKCA